LPVLLFPSCLFSPTPRPLPLREHFQSGDHFQFTALVPGRNTGVFLRAFFPSPPMFPPPVPPRFDDLHESWPSHRRLPTTGGHLLSLYSYFSVSFFFFCCAPTFFSRVDVLLVVSFQSSPLFTSWIFLFALPLPSKIPLPLSAGSRWCSVCSIHSKYSACPASPTRVGVSPLYNIGSFLFILHRELGPPPPPSTYLPHPILSSPVGVVPAIPWVLLP